MATQILDTKRHWLKSILVACTYLGTTLTGQTPLSADDDVEFFEKSIRPILVERCESCHSLSQGKANGGLTLDTRAGWQRGGETGPPIIAGDPDKSLLVQAVRYDEDGPQMPPSEAGGKLPEREIRAIVEWVERGAPDPRVAETRIGGMTESEVRQWWSFQPLRDVPPPVTRNADWPKNEIDRFVLAKLETRGIAPAPAAERRTLIRRMTFDLTGLPPTPAETDAFLRDQSSRAVEHVVERLLASKAYGQRWARHWLDVVRYADYYDADAKARQMTAEPLDAWRYRDWVVDALNADLPYNKFIVHQIAGDRLPNPDGSEIYPAGLIATTFLSNGVWDPHDADKEKIVSDMADDNIDTIGKAFLGLTLGCARCHDHKFDPVSTEDYYALAGIFYSSHFLQELGTKGGAYTMSRIPLVPAKIVDAYEEKLARLNEAKKRLQEYEKQNPKPADNDPRRLQLIRLQEQLQRELPPEPPRALAVQEGGTPAGLFPGIQDVPIHIRGSYARLGKTVPRRLPMFLVDDSRQPTISGSGRMELAQWVAAADNPLTVRVIVNRVWQWHFGEGLVRTPSNFGKLGERPTHPELLDWLAARFVEDGWSLRQLHRRIMLSSTYQQSSRSSSPTDPENRWLSHFSPRRLDAEEIRDAMLYVAGQLDPKVGGPAGQDFTIRRRSLYVQTARWNRSSFAMLFDAANPDASTERRVASTIAPQALLLLNHPFAFEQSKHLAEKLRRAGETDESIEFAYSLLFARRPTSEEMRIALELVGDGQLSGWTDLAHVLLCSNEFVYVD